ncbi:MAG: hypothetical protein KA368_14520 [Acidobacteria bacterium]|nr:hypothetical protein [Acidobacteriota bacterium]
MKGTIMAKTPEKFAEAKEEKIKKESSKSKDKNSGVLVGRVKKVIKKSRRKMGDEKFEKQLQRTITFLEELQRRIAEAGIGKTEKKSKPASKAASKAKVKKAAPKTKPKTNDQ